MRWVSLLLAYTLVGCATRLPPLDAPAVQLANVPGFQQDELQCGPAALASVLSASGVPATPEALKPDLFIPARKGSLQVELAAQARLRGRVPLLLETRETDLLAALNGGHPPLVLLNLGVRSHPIWHYAVLTGYDADAGYTLHYGKAEPVTLSRGIFLRQWDWAGRWALTLHAPEAIPAYADAARWIAAAAPLQRSQPALAEAAYRAATVHWTEAALAWAALGESRFAAGDAKTAAVHLRRAASLDPHDAALANNLASVELARGCVTAARAALQAVDWASAPPAVAAVLQETQRELDTAGADRCPAQ